MADHQGKIRTNANTSRDNGLFENIDFGTPSLGPQEASLYVDGLSKTFGRGDSAINAINNISFAAEPGEVIGLLGPNGAGKTTTIKAILGLVLPDKGHVRIHGIDPYSEPRQAYAHVDAMFEGARNDYWRLTVLENLQYFAAVRGQDPKSLTDRHEEVLERMGIADQADTQVRNLSRGMKQKVSLASILAADVTLAFLDEPTLGLDVETTIQLRGELTRLADEHNITLLLCSHNMDVIESVCDRVIIINQGQIIANDEVEELLSGFERKEYRFTIRGMNKTFLSDIHDRFNVTNVKRVNGKTKFGVTLDSMGFYNLTNVMERKGLELVKVESIQPDLTEVFLKMTEGMESASLAPANIRGESR